MPPLNVTAKGAVFESEGQQLDGMACTICSFIDVTLTYAGGSYSLVNRRFSGTTRFEFKGAAANTLAILPLMEALVLRTPPKIPPPKIPMHRNVTTEQPMSIGFASPYGR